MRRIIVYFAFSILLFAAFADAGTGKNKREMHRPVYTQENPSLGSNSMNTASGAAAIPNDQIRVHKAGNLRMTITNYGMFGTGMESLIDPETGLPAPSCEFPAGSGNDYLYMGSVWIGAITNNDTLVSVGADGWQWVYEMNPNAYPGGDIIKRSNIPGNPHYSPDAISEEDFIAVYNDTITDPSYVNPDPFDARPHIPLGLEIRQESYAWSDAEYEDFIIFRFIISNITQNQLNDIYVGLYYDADIYNPGYNNAGYEDDISGSIQFYDDSTGEDVLIGWAADNDGDPVSGSWDYYSPRGVLGVSLLEFPNTSEAAFNWWISNGNFPENYDWGPMLSENYRDFGTGGLGTPEGDRNKYYVMSNGEHDYDQLFTNIDYTGEGWLPPPYSPYAQNLADGYDTRFLFSFGGADLNPGESIELAFVLAMGDDFHRNPDDFNNLFDANNPQAYYDSLNFSNLIANVLAARQLYSSLLPQDNVCGDINGDRIINIADVVYFINYMFISGEAPDQIESADVNCDGKINLVDIIYLVNYIFRGGNAPGDPNGDGTPDC